MLYFYAKNCVINCVGREKKKKNTFLQKKKSFKNDPSFFFLIPWSYVTFANACACLMFFSKECSMLTPYERTLSTRSKTSTSC